MPLMKLKEIQSNLQGVDVFDKPNILLEQYPTSPHIAACMAHTIGMRYGDIEDKVIADLGCGCGMLSIACVMLDCQRCIGYDIDPAALAVCRQNLEEHGIENVEVHQQDVSLVQPWDDAAWCDTVDTVVMNPPFGTKKNEGLDMHFLEVALAMARHSVYSLHKTSTRKYIKLKCDWLGVEMSPEAELKFDLDKKFHCHKKDSVTVEVDFIRFSFRDNKQKFYEQMKKKSVKAGTE